MTCRIATTAFALALLAAPLAVTAADSGPAGMPAGTYSIDPHHASSIGSVSHFGRSTYVFRFDKFDASYDYDPEAPDAAKLTVSIDVNSLDTGWDTADKEFSRDFAGGGKTPVARFVSTTVTHSGSSGVVTGDLTLNGVTKPVSLAVTLTDMVHWDPWASSARRPASRRPAPSSGRTSD